jgi:hypothetical protein
LLGRAPASQGRHLTGFASLMASPPLRGPPGGSRKNLAIRAKKSEKRKMKNEKRKMKNEKRKTKNEKRKTKNEKRKMKNEKRKTKNEK